MDNRSTIAASDKMSSQRPVAPAVACQTPSSSVACGQTLSSSVACGPTLSSTVACSQAPLSAVTCDRLITSSSNGCRELSPPSDTVMSASSSAPITTQTVSDVHNSKVETTSAAVADRNNNATGMTISIFHICFPLPSARQHPSYGDSLEVKREYYQNSSVLDCVTQCSQSAANLYEQFLQVKQIGFVTLGYLRCA